MTNYAVMLERLDEKFPQFAENKNQVQYELVELSNYSYSYFTLSFYREESDA
ncbi:hypothetical protein [Neobacillus drentensis]|uniref:hypothetical protein n=1 Tax=Neobacillus drentensis TaxID=220684 RepID=UPI002FFFC511